MDLIERYLGAIARQLPDKQVGDITAELRDVLLSQVEDEEARLGRPLTRAELEAVLVDFGHPLSVAGRYRGVQHLIGPEVFPFWWAAIKVMLSILAGVYLVLIVAGILTHKTFSDFNRAVPNFGYVAVYLFGLITLVCMGVERFGKTRVLQRWKPSRLPPAKGKQRSRVELAAEIGADLVFIAWWSGLIRFVDLVPFPHFVRFDLAPVWAAWHWPILGYFVVEMVADLIAIARPDWTRANLAILALRYLAGIAILLQVMRAGHWLSVSSAAIPPHALALVQANADLAMRAGVGLAIAGMVLRIALEVWRLRRLLRAQDAAPQAA
jgi:hypothetical protein